MENQEKLYQLMTRTLRAFAPFYQESVARLLETTGRPDNWFSLNAVRYYDPRPATLADLLLLYPYESPTRRSEILSGLAGDGCLTGNPEQGYQLTDLGRSIIEGFFQVAHDELAGIAPLPEGELNRAAELLDKLVEAAASAPTPVLKTSLQSSRWTDPGPDSPPAVRIDQSVTDLLHFRDDAHVASWRELGVDGRTWETLTLLWREEADTVDALAKTLAHRGFEAADYAASLTALVDLGWVEQEGAGYQITTAGKEVRQKAEERTDQLFYGGWSVLNQNELDELEALLARASEKLEARALRHMWDLAGEVSQAVFQVTRPIVAPLAEKRFPPATFLPVAMAMGLAPKPLTASDFHKRVPYASRARIEEIMASAAEAGLLSANGGNGSRPRSFVSPEGRSAFNELNRLFYRHLEELDILPEADLDDLASLLDRLVEASLAAEEPTDAWLVQISRRSHPANDYGPLARIDQHLDDLNAFRDDAHLASWAPHGVDGRRWDALTFIWREGPSTPLELAERLSFRGFGEADYARALSDLAGRGWLNQTGGSAYALSEAGRQVRQDAEEATDRFFFGPWSVLEDNELAHLRHLLIRLKIALEKLIPEPANA